MEIILITATLKMRMKSFLKTRSVMVLINITFMSFDIYCNKSEQESKLSPLNHVTSLWNQQLPLFVALMQGLEKKSIM